MEDGKTSLEEKVRIAHETFSKTGIEDIVQLVHGDARELINRYEGIAFCFLDCEKDYYLNCYEAVIQKNGKWRHIDS